MWTVEIINPILGTFDISDRVLSIKTAETLDNQSDTFTIDCKNIYEVHKLAKVLVKRDGTVKYSGYILNQEDSDAGYKHTYFYCVDWSDILHNRVIAKTYLSEDGLSPDGIIKDILSTKVPEVTFNNVRVCNTVIERIYFPYDSVMKAIERLMEFLPGWHWFIDENKDFHFFNRYEKDGPVITTATVLDKTLSVQHSTEATANRVWVIGSKQSSPKFIEEFFTADGVQRVFKLAYEPNFSEIYIDNVLKKSKIESNDDGQQDFLINKGEKVFYIPENIATPFSGTIKYSYRPTIQVIDYFENYGSIRTHGLYERVIKNKDITDKTSARQFGKAEIKRRTENKRVISFDTYEDVQIGERRTLNYVTPQWNITGQFLIVSVNRTINIRANPAKVRNTVVLEEIT